MNSSYGKKLWVTFFIFVLFSFFSHFSIVNLLFLQSEQYKNIILGDSKTQKVMGKYGFNCALLYQGLPGCSSVWDPVPWMVAFGPLSTMAHVRREPS